LVDVTWHGTKLNQPGWDDSNARTLAYTLAGFNGDPDLHVMMNMFWQPQEFELPVVQGWRWFKAIDTFQPSPQDIADPGAEAPISGATCPVESRSIAVLVNRPLQ
jgi:isoamylase